jgi:hypothetical protein
MNPICVVRHFRVFARGSRIAKAPIAIGETRTIFSHSGQLWAEYSVRSSQRSPPAYELPVVSTNSITKSISENGKNKTNVFGEAS